MKVFVCRSGEIGRRPGLKIPCDESHVPVRARFPAPILLFRFAGTARQTLFHPKRQYRGVEQLVARRAHNPEVVWFKSHPRNQKINTVQKTVFIFFFKNYAPTCMRPTANNSEGEAVANDIPRGCHGRRADRGIFNAVKNERPCGSSPPAP